ncbi:uncharacterized protein LOC130520119 isoform X6 [Takifugu flavidus]|uniref:uncharacterized protein LOC130520119 isoform X6 n=1 Tax=Takifugu flavidus TaxID=433684 RepID=UPI0025448271|nr:uncharacterized protein LOC130520119 isoform X6 [Takifugu flavidus]
MWQQPASVGLVIEATSFEQSESEIGSSPRRATRPDWDYVRDTTRKLSIDFRHGERCIWNKVLCLRGFRNKNAHMEWVSKMKRVGHTEVNIPEDADYYLVFCPVKSRIKTDIDEALEGLPDNKAVILVVMHHTFDPHLVIVESRLQELPRNVRLTVDSLFYQGRLLRCNRNDIAWNQIQKSLNIPIPEPSWWMRLFNSVLLYLSGTKFFVCVASETRNKLMGWVSKMPSWWKRLFNSVLLYLSGTKFFVCVASETRNKLMGWVSKMPSWWKRPFNLSGTKFFVYVASETKNAHMEWVSKMKRVGHTEVNIQEDADFYLVFCPVKSRIKTDIDEALEGLPDNKAIILVVMHHTFDPDLVIVESRLQELPRNVHLTVDSLFYRGRLLRCNRNDIAWNQIQKSLNILIPEPSWWKRLFNSVLLYSSGTKFFVCVASETRNKLMGWVSKMVCKCVTVAWNQIQKTFNIPIPEPSWWKRPFNLSGTKFFVYVASETKNAHMEWVSKMKRVGHTEVNIQEDADFYLVFCPVKSRIKTDIDEALEGLPGSNQVGPRPKVGGQRDHVRQRDQGRQDGHDNKALILVVMHHTFDPDLVIVESRLQELPRNVRLTVDSLFYQGRLLWCNRNDIAWDQIQKSLNIPIPEVPPSWWMRLFNLSGTKFFVYVASETKNAHMEWVSKMKRVGHTEVNIQEDADYYLVFCPVKSRIKTDIDEALEGLPDNKAVILVVMHHTFDPDLVIVESRLQELPRNVRLTVDSLFHQGRLLRCNRNDIAWDQIQKTFNIPIPEPSWRMRPFNYLVKHKELLLGIAIGIVLDRLMRSINVGCFLRSMSILRLVKVRWPVVSGNVQTLFKDKRTQERHQTSRSCSN